MNISFYSGKTSMIAQQQGLNIHANNVANVNTVGFKTLRPSFAECIYVRYRATEADWETGHGQYLMKTDLMWKQGQFVETEQPLDYALPGDGFFMVSDRNGNTHLTRDGAFKLSFNEDDGVWQLTAATGEYVLGYDREVIQIPFVVEQDEDGNDVVTTAVDYAALDDMIGVFSVANNWGLEQAGSNRFLVTERSGEAQPDFEHDKIARALERSAVDLAEEMVKIIETQRSYQLSARLIQTSDEFIRIANNLRS